MDDINRPGTDWEQVQRILSEYCHAVDEGRFAVKAIIGDGARVEAPHGTGRM